jgi:hypothetical protein
VFPHTTQIAVFSCLALLAACTSTGDGGDDGGADAAADRAPQIDPAKCATAEAPENATTAGLDGGANASSEAGPDDPYYNCQPLDAAAGHCPCHFTNGGGLNTMACSSEILRRRPYRHSRLHEHRVLVVLSSCAASADDILYCEAGTHPLPPR